MNRAKQLEWESVCGRGILLAGLLGVVLTFLAPSGSAQSTGGRVRGTVSDASGGIVTGVTVTLTNTATNVSRQTVTSANGEYLFLEVPVGPYEISVNQPGFKKFLRKDITVDLNTVVGVDIALQLGGSTEVVEVTGEPPVIDTTTTQLGAVVGSREVTQLPLNTRDTYQLLQLQPGVQSQLGNDLFYGSDKPGVVTVNGGRGRSNNYSVNGGDGNDLFANLPAVQPSPDSIEEFRVITNSFDAEYGRNSGSVVNVVTKSGTNQFHGSAFEFFRNTVLDARPFTFTPSNKPDFQQNQFGGTLGGPIRKDKTFFFASYEGRRIKQGILSNPVPLLTSDQLNNGNFGSGSLTGTLTTAPTASVLQGRCGAQLTPAANTELSNIIGGGTPTSGNYGILFPNGVIPTQCYDPLSVGIYNQYVHPTSDGVFQAAPNKIDNGDQFTIKVDQDLTKNQKLAVYYYFDDDNTSDPFAKFQQAGGNLGNFPGLYSTRTQQVNITHTWTIGSTSVNEFRFSYFREGQGQFNSPTVTGGVQSSCGSAAAAFCFTGTTDQPLVDGSGNILAPSKAYGIYPNLGASKEGLPFITVGGGMSVGNNFEGQLPQTGNTFQWADNFSKILGTHSLKFGGDIRYQKFDQTLYYNVNGYYQFLPGGANDTGNNYADYLLGLPNNYSQGSAQQELVRSTSVYLFVQDSWKARANLTFNYGLRWEMNTPLTDIGKKVQTYRPGQVSTIYPCQLDPSNPLYDPTQADGGCQSGGLTPLGLVFPGDKGVPGGLTNTYYKAFAPRLGLNWSPAATDGLLKDITGGPGRTSISAGWGLFYNPIEQLVLEQFSAEPPFGGSNYITDPVYQAPFVTQGGSVNPNPFNGILNPPRGQPIDWSNFRSILLYGQFPANLRTQYAAQYNLTVKREFPGNLLFQVGYVGTQGHRLLGSYDLNHGNPDSCNGLAAIPGVLNGPGGSPLACSSFGADNSYFIPPGTVIPNISNIYTPGFNGLILPYNAGSYDLNHGNPDSCNGLAAISAITPNGVLNGPGGSPLACSSYGADNSYFIPPGTVIPNISNIYTPGFNGLILPYNAGSGGTQIPAGTVVGPNGITLVGIRQYSSPLCQPLTGAGCPVDGIPVFSNIFTENTIAHSNYNSLQVLVEKRYSHGLQFSGAYTYSKSLDNSSSFESSLNPINLNATYGPSLFDARHRFVFSYVWEIPAPKYDGFKGQMIDGWQVSGIVTYQTGFPVRITSSDDVEEFSSTFFEAPGEPNYAPGYPTTHLTRWNPKTHGGITFDPNQFTNTTVPPGTIGNAPRSICCQPGIANWDMGFFKGFQLKERFQMQFRAELYNIWNHAQFYSVDGNISDGPTFGLAQKVRDPRTVQFALKFLF